MPVRRTEQMHHHRVSIPGALYFVTCCTSRRQPGLVNPMVADSLVQAVKKCDAAAESCTVAFTVMPDHCHWLFQLSEQLPLGRLLAKFKFQTRIPLRLYGLDWQRDYYDHRLRSHEELEDYALYIFLNPYRAGLVPIGHAWPWWWTGSPQPLRFLALLDAAGSPPPEWAGMPVPESIKHGE